MCNAWNHPANCNCGWGGSGTGGWKGGQGSSYCLSAEAPRLIEYALVKAGYDSSFSAITDDAETYQTECWWCGALVYYHSNGYGDSVFFDSLGGCPWQVHSCWQNYWKQEKSRRQAKEPVILRSLESNQLKRLILAGVIHTLSSKGIKLTEKQLAIQLGVSVEQLRQEYYQVYNLYMEGGAAQVRLK